MNDSEYEYVYEISSTEQSSNHYGNCEVCGKHVSEVFYQTENRKYFNPIANKQSLTSHQCKNLFGHQECLIGVRR